MMSAGHMPSCLLKTFRMLISFQRLSLKVAKMSTFS